MPNILLESIDSFGHAHIVNDREKYEDLSTYVMGKLSSEYHSFEVEYDVFTF